MDEKEHSRFRICIEEEDRPETGSLDKVLEKKIKKARSPVPYVAIALFCILGGLIGFGYFDLKKRFDRMNTTGAVEFDSLSKKLEQTLISHSENKQAIRGTLSEKFTSIGKKINDLRETLQVVEKKMSALETAKPDKKEIEGEFAKMNQAVSLVQKELATATREISANIKKSDLELAKMAGNIGKMNNGMGQIHSSLDNLSSQKVDKRILDIQFNGELRSYRLALKEAITKMDAKIQAVENKLESLEKGVGHTGQKPSVRQAGLPDTSPAKPGKIVEQDIKD
ncbi:MAG: hypothetical protein V1714_01400 [Pseudomonadota bacterium]